MAGRNDRDMIRRIISTICIWAFSCICSFAQHDTHLVRLANDLVQFRKAANNNILNKTVINWSASGAPKMTLMDNIKRDDKNEYRGNGANRFKINQIITHVYNRQNTGMVSKGDYFNSTEKDIHYSAIEKNIKGKSTVTYTLTGHIGVQEFVFISYNPNTRFSAKVNGKEAKPAVGKNGVLFIRLPYVSKDQKIVFSITNKSSANESFVILNHNPQK